MRLGNSRAGGFHQFFESLIAEIAEDHPRGLVLVLGKLSLHFWVYVSRNHKHIRIAIVIQIDDPDAPTDKTRLYTNATLPGDVVEIPLSVAAVENIGVPPALPRARIR